MQAGIVSGVTARLEATTQDIAAFLRSHLGRSGSPPDDAGLSTPSPRALRRHRVAKHVTFATPADGGDGEGDGGSVGAGGARADSPVGLTDVSEDGPPPFTPQRAAPSSSRWRRLLLHGARAVLLARLRGFALDERSLAEADVAAIMQLRHDIALLTHLLAVYAEDGDDGLADAATQTSPQATVAARLAFRKTAAATDDGEDASDDVTVTSRQQPLWAKPAHANAAAAAAAAAAAVATTPAASAAITPGVAQSAARVTPLTIASDVASLRSSGVGSLPATTPAPLTLYHAMSPSPSGASTTTAHPPSTSTSSLTPTAATSPPPLAAAASPALQAPATTSHDAFEDSRDEAIAWDNISHVLEEAGCAELLPLLQRDAATSTPPRPHLQPAGATRAYDHGNGSEADALAGAAPSPLPRASNILSPALRSKVVSARKRRRGSVEAGPDSSGMAISPPRPAATSVAPLPPSPDMQPPVAVPEQAPPSPLATAASALASSAGTLDAPAAAAPAAAPMSDAERSALDESLASAHEAIQRFKAVGDRLDISLAHSLELTLSRISAGNSSAAELPHSPSSARGILGDTSSLTARDGDSSMIDGGSSGQVADDREPARNLHAPTATDEEQLAPAAVQPLVDVSAVSSVSSHGSHGVGEGGDGDAGAAAMDRGSTPHAEHPAMGVDDGAMEVSPRALSPQVLPLPPSAYDVGPAVGLQVASPPAAAPAPAPDVSSPIPRSLARRLLFADPPSSHTPEIARRAVPTPDLVTTISAATGTGVMALHDAGMWAEAAVLAASPHSSLRDAPAIASEPGDTAHHVLDVQARRGGGGGGGHRSAIAQVLLAARLALDAAQQPHAMSPVPLAATSELVPGRGSRHLAVASEASPARPRDATPGSSMRWSPGAPASPLLGPASERVAAAGSTPTQSPPSRIPTPRRLDPIASPRAHRFTCVPAAVAAATASSLAAAHAADEAARAAADAAAVTAVSPPSPPSAAVGIRAPTTTPVRGAARARLRSLGRSPMAYVTSPPPPPSTAREAPAASAVAAAGAAPASPAVPAHPHRSPAAAGGAAAPQPSPSKPPYVRPSPDRIAAAIAALTPASGGAAGRTRRRGRRRTPSSASPRSPAASPATSSAGHLAARSAPFGSAASPAGPRAVALSPTPAMALALAAAAAAASAGLTAGRSSSAATPVHASGPSRTPSTPFTATPAAPAASPPPSLPPPAGVGTPGIASEYRRRKPVGLLSPAVPSSDAGDSSKRLSRIAGLSAEAECEEVSARTPSRDGPAHGVVRMLGLEERLSLSPVSPIGAALDFEALDPLDSTASLSGSGGMSSFQLSGSAVAGAWAVAAGGSREDAENLGPEVLGEAAPVAAAAGGGGGTGHATARRVLRV